MKNVIKHKIEKYEYVKIILNFMVDTYKTRL